MKGWSGKLNLIDEFTIIASIFCVQIIEYVGQKWLSGVHICCIIVRFSILAVTEIV